ncbi:MAG: Fic family protein [Proteobacteria bacterium]|nr:Fic family protein [Pseudomonadota bacterium]
MKWNWQQADWPNFKYDKSQLESFEYQFLKEEGLLLGTFKHLNEGDKTDLTIDIICNEAIKTSEIEGEYLNRESVQSSIRREFGLETDRLRASPAEQGVAEMMVDVYRSFGEPLTHSKLFAWHEMAIKGRRDLIDMGRYRTHKEAMQVISGDIHHPKVHFEAPPSTKMGNEMEKFVNWFNETSSSKLTPLSRAGIAHLYFVCIHPFEDGNGRIGRAIVEKALAQSFGQPTLIALAYTIEKHKKAYYDALEKANKSNEVTEWLLYFAPTILEAQQYTQIYITFLIEKTKFYDTFRGKLNERQEKVLTRMFNEGPEGFKGGLSAEKYISITKTSRATATRDLQDLVSMGALTKSGQQKYTRYKLNMVLKPHGLS